MSKPKKPAAEKAAPAKPIRPPSKVEISLRVIFTTPELLELGKKLAEATQAVAAAENEKKDITSRLKAKCDEASSRAERLSSELTSGYTYRPVPCEVRFDTPANGQKTTVRLDTRETVSVDAMTLAEMQAELPLKEPAAPVTLHHLSPTPRVVDPVVRKTASPGTVECPADAGTRDDAGDESKNK